MNQNSTSGNHHISLRRSFFSCLLAVMMILTLMPVSALSAKAEEMQTYWITLVAGDPGYMTDENGTPVSQITLESDGSPVFLGVPFYPEGYTFTGWFTDPECTMFAEYDANYMFVPYWTETVLYAGCQAPAEG